MYVIVYLTFTPMSFLMDFLVNRLREIDRLTDTMINTIFLLDDLA